jgi:hypothetical protein
LASESLAKSKGSFSVIDRDLSDALNIQQPLLVDSPRTSSHLATSRHKTRYKSGY